MRRLEVECFKHDGSFHRRWSGFVSEYESDDLFVLFSFKTKIREHSGHLWFSKEPALFILFKHEWQNIICRQMKDGISFYVNLASPAILDGNTIKFIDYDLDLKLDEFSHLALLDEIEYQHHALKYQYSEKIDKILHAQIETIKRKMMTLYPPYHLKGPLGPDDVFLFKPHPFLETERLILRKLVPGDFEELSKILRDPVTTEAYVGPFDERMISEFFQKQTERYQEYGYGWMGLFLKTDSQLIGFAGLTKQMVKGIEVTELGYMLGSKHFKNNYAFEASAELLHFAFKSLELSEVYSIIRLSNVRSLDLALKNHMVLSGLEEKNYRALIMPHLVMKCSKEGYLSGIVNIKKESV